MPNYDVNVRAIVKAESLHPDAPTVIDGWEVYDSSTEMAEGGFTRVTLRCDQLVRVEADGEDEAVRAAKDAATLIVIDGWNIDEVKLWVDEGIDVELVEPEAEVAP